MGLDKLLLLEFSKKTGYSIEKSKEVLKMEINKFIEQDAKLSKSNPDYVTCWEVFEFNLKRYYK